MGQLLMKKLALFPALALIALALNSCCNSCTKRSNFAFSGASNDCYVEKEVTEWVEEEVYVDGGGKGGKMGTVTQSRPVTKTVKVKVECPPCGTFWRDSSGCCDLLGDSVYSRVTAQGGTGEPHIGLVPTMRVLAE